MHMNHVCEMPAAIACSDFAIPQLLDVSKLI